MKILVVGCGSIGTRRAKILAKMGHEVYGYDVEMYRAAQAAIAVSQLEVARPYDVALICTPPDSGRPEQIQRCIELGVRGLYVEKPLALDRSDVDEIAGFATSYENSGVVTMGACNLRFCGGVAGLRKLPKPWRLLQLTMRQHARYWNPEHRPVTMALDSFHELDLATYLAGPVETLRGWSAIDAAELSVHHRGGGLSHIFLDRRGDPPVRRVKVVRDGALDSLRLRTDDGMYRRELEHFIGCVERGEETCNPLSQVAELCERALEVAT